MTERGVHLDHSTIHRWVIRFSPLLLERFNQCKRTVTRRWYIDDPEGSAEQQDLYSGPRTLDYLYRAIDSVGDTVEFFFSEHRDLAAARRSIRKALRRHGRPERIVVDGSQTNRETITAYDGESRLLDRSIRSLVETDPRPSTISQRPQNRITDASRAEFDQCRVQVNRLRSDLLSGIEMVHVTRKRQAGYAYNPAPSLSKQVEMLAS